MRIDAIHTVYFDGVAGEKELTREDWAALGVNITCTLHGRDVNAGTPVFLRTEAFRKHFVRLLRSHDIETMVEGGALLVTHVAPFGPLPAAPPGWHAPHAPEAHHTRKRKWAARRVRDDDLVADGVADGEEVAHDLEKMIAKAQRNEPALLGESLSLLSLFTLAFLVGYLGNYFCSAPVRVAPRNVRLSRRAARQLSAQGQALRFGGGASATKTNASLREDQKKMMKSRKKSRAPKVAPSGAVVGAQDLHGLPSV